MIKKDKKGQIISDAILLGIKILKSKQFLKDSFTISRSNANVAIKSRMKEGVDKSAPSFGRPLGDVECDEGLKLRITTPIKGNPIPEFCWTKDGKPLSGDRVNSFSDGELVSYLLPLLLKSISFKVEVVLEREIGCVLIIQQKF